MPAKTTTGRVYRASASCLPASVHFMAAGITRRSKIEIYVIVVTVMTMCADKREERNVTSLSICSPCDLHSGIRSSGMSVQLDANVSSANNSATLRRLVGVVKMTEE